MLYKLWPFLQSRTCVSSDAEWHGQAGEGVLASEPQRASARTQDQEDSGEAGRRRPPHQAGAAGVNPPVLHGLVTSLPRPATASQPSTSLSVSLCQHRRW